MSAPLPAILHLYWFPPDGFAPSMREHIEAFALHSRHPVLAWNTARGFVDELENHRFCVVLLHYSLFGGPIHWLSDRWLEYLRKQTDAVKVAIFQDEYRFWGIRHLLLDDIGINLVFSCFATEDHGQTYGLRGWSGRIEHSLTGYVGHRLLERSRTLYRPLKRRAIDVGYRARRLDEYMGRGAAEKHRIADFFLQDKKSSRLRLDISTREEDRIYGDEWYAFLADCKAVLGVEAGVSIVDTEDVLWPAWRRYKTLYPDADWERTHQDLGMEEFEGGPYLRTISPRHFEAAAMGCVQVLFEGRYSDILEPMRHYIPLAKDASNLDEVLRLLADDVFCKTMTERAKKEIIDSGAYGYDRFVARFDRLLKDCGVEAGGKHQLSIREHNAVKQVSGILLKYRKTSEESLAQGGQWQGPHLFPRPNWPANLTHLKNLDYQQILATKTSPRPPAPGKQQYDLDLQQ